jgi:hypothetical protein
MMKRPLFLWLIGFFVFIAQEAGGEKSLYTRDPFQFGDEGSSCPISYDEQIYPEHGEDLVLQGFVEDHALPAGRRGKYSAFISDDLVEKGDKVMGWTVHSISKDTVILIKGEKRRVLRNP